MEILRKDALSLDEILIKSNLDVKSLMIILTNLEMNGIIKKISAERYIIV